MFEIDLVSSPAHTTSINLSNRWANEAQRRGYWFTHVFNYCTRVKPSEVFPNATIADTRGTLTNDKADETAIIEGDDALIHLLHSGGILYVGTASKRRERSIELEKMVREKAPETKDIDPTKVTMTFWSYNRKTGPESTTREITIRQWDEINHNYGASAYEGLTHLMNEDFRPGHGGQLMLWNGDPGTGKTTALRALAGEWREWCSFHYVADPEVFFGDSAYMLQVLLAPTKKDRWRVLILEDTGELLAANAKLVAGQAVSRLLNTVDGILGQGLNTLVLVTTNEPLSKLYPAITRPGRCASRIEFGPLTPQEVEHWALKEGYSEKTFPLAMTLADLYAETEAFEKPHIKDQKLVGFGL